MPIVLCPFPSGRVTEATHLPSFIPYPESLDQSFSALAPLLAGIAPNLGGIYYSDLQRHLSTLTKNILRGTCAMNVTSAIIQTYIQCGPGEGPRDIENPNGRKRDITMMDYRAQRNAHRRQRRGYSEEFGGLIGLIVIASLAMIHLWQLSILAFIGLLFFFLVLRLIPFGPAHAMNQQQYSQPKQEQPLYQQPYQPYQQEQPDYQPYPLGYGAQHPPMRQSEIYQEGEQQYQYPAQQIQQYEEPIAVYPQE